MTVSVTDHDCTCDCNCDTVSLCHCVTVSLCHLQGLEVLKMSGELLLAVVGNMADPLQLAVATDRQGLMLAAEARVRRGTLAAQELLNQV